MGTGNMGKYTIKDIADMAGVSPATVSRVLSDTPGVNPKKRMEIKQLIKDTGYHPSSVARSLVKGRTNVVGVVVRDLENPYYASMAVGFQKELAKIGYIPLVISVEAGEAKGTGRNYLSEINRLFDFAGLFVSVQTRENILEESIKECQCPVVLLNRTFDIMCDQVIQNDYQAGVIAAEYLSGLGHRNIMILQGLVRESPSCRFRMEGFQQTLSVSGIELEAENMIESPLDMNAAYEVSLERLKNRELPVPTAAFVSGNSMALGFLKACGELGIRVPEEISVVTIDNPPIMSLPGINLTTISVSMDTMVSEAVKVFQDRVEDKNKKHRFVVLRPELIVRGSARPLSEAGE